MTDPAAIAGSDDVAIDSLDVDAQSPDRELSGRLFGFVSIAYGLAITVVFPVVYETLRESWILVKSLPETGRPWYGEELLLLTSKRFWTMLAPYADKVFMALSLLGIWLGYFFLMAKIRSSTRRQIYTPGLMLLDLSQAMLLFFTAQSLKNYADKPLPRTDTSWFLLLLILFILYWRVLFGALSVVFPQRVVVGVSTQYMHRVLITLGHLTCASLAVAYFGFRCDSSALEAGQFLKAANSALLIYSLSLVFLGLVVFVARHNKAGGQDLRECWRWAWRKESRVVALGLLLCAAFHVFLAMNRHEVLESFVEWKNVIPLGSLFLVFIIAAIIGVWLVGGGPKYGPRVLGSREREIRGWLHRLRDDLDRLCKGSQAILLIASEPSGPRSTITIGSCNGAAKEAAVKMAGKIFEMPIKELLRQYENGAGPTIFGVNEPSFEESQVTGSIVSTRSKSPVLGTVASVTSDLGPNAVLALVVNEDSIEPADAGRSHRSLMAEVESRLVVTSQALAWIYADSASE